MKTMVKMGVALMITTFVFAETITIPNGTVVPVRTMAQLSSGQLSMGQEVIFNVAQDVKIKGKTVIKAKKSRDHTEILFKNLPLNFKFNTEF